MAAHTAQLINVADLAAPFEPTRQTIPEHVTLLERVFLLERLPPWHTNRMGRAVKRPNLHVGDTGVAESSDARKDYTSASIETGTAVAPQISSAY